MGSSYTGDIAIDDVAVTSGSCDNRTVLPTSPSIGGKLSPCWLGLKIFGYIRDVYNRSYVLFPIKSRWPQKQTYFLYGRQRDRAVNTSCHIRYHFQALVRFDLFLSYPKLKWAKLVSSCRWAFASCCCCFLFLSCVLFGLFTFSNCFCCWEAAFSR